MWILPTYNRPELLYQTLKHCRETGVSTKGIILINGGDYDLANKIPAGWEVITVRENLGWAQSCNHVFEKFPNESWYGFFYDDMKPVTEGWDRKLVDTLDEKTLIASAENNWHKPPRIQTAVISGDLVREVGWLCLPGTWGCFTDDFWEHLGRQLGIWKVQEDVVVETLNPRKGDYAWDDATATAYNKETFEKDSAIWEAFIEKEYRELRERVREKFNVGASRKVDLPGIRVMIATPCLFGKMESRYVGSLCETINLFQNHGIGWGIHVLDKCTILPHARNRLVAEFLDTEATHLLFIDDDMGWPPETVMELLAHDKDVIAAVGITKEDDPEKRRFCVQTDPRYAEYDATRGLLRVKGVGTGFMLIKRHVLEKMWDKYKRNSAGPPSDHPGLGPIPRIFTYDYESDDWGEDYTFCRRWREMGGEIWVDPGLRLEHVGSFIFTGTYLDWLQDKWEREQNAA